MEVGYTMTEKKYTKKQLQDELYEMNKRTGAEATHTFAEHLKNTRAMFGISQRDVSSYFGIPEKTYSAWERGRREPPIYFQSLLLGKIIQVFSKHGNILQALLAESIDSFDIDTIDNVPF